MLMHTLRPELREKNLPEKRLVHFSSDTRLGRVREPYAAGHSGVFEERGCSWIRSPVATSCSLPGDQPSKPEAQCPAVPP